jgi:hypothetical protein
MAQGKMDIGPRFKVRFTGGTPGDGRHGNAVNIPDGISEQRIGGLVPEARSDRVQYSLMVSPALLGLCLLKYKEKYNTTILQTVVIIYIRYSRVFNSQKYGHAVRCVIKRRAPAVRKRQYFISILCLTVLLTALSGCFNMTADELYSLPQASKST